nr:MAG: putative lysis protein [Leviviridae sp.]
MIKSLLMRFNHLSKWKKAYVILPSIGAVMYSIMTLGLASPETVMALKALKGEVCGMSLTPLIQPFFPTLDLSSLSQTGSYPASVHPTVNSNHATDQVQYRIEALRALNTSFPTGPINLSGFSLLLSSDIRISDIGYNQ